MSERSALHALGTVIAGSLLAGLAAVLFLSYSGSPRQPHAAPRVGAAGGSLQLPLAFEPDAGRFGRGLRFLARGGGYSLGLERGGSAVLHSRSGRIRMAPVGARRAEARPETKLRGKVNWYVGKDPSRWRSALPTYGAVRYRQVYPGIDLVYHGRSNRLEYDYELAPGASADAIRIAVSGGRAPRLERGGDLVIPTVDGPLRQRRPVAYQTMDGRRVPVRARFTLDGRRVGFRVGSYDARHPLVIDPQLIFTTYMGGSASDTANAATILQATGKFLLVGGQTSSSPFLGTGGDPPGADGWVAKVSDDGSAASFITFVGGSGSDSVSGVAVAGGSIVAGGSTTSNDLPLTAGSMQPSYNDNGDAFISKLNATTGVVERTSYLGGSGADSLVGLAPQGSNVALAGNTMSADFPTTPGAFATQPGASAEMFVASVPADPTQPGWSTYLGGDLDESAKAVTVDNISGSKAVYVTGWTDSSNFPVTSGSGDATFLDAFVTKFNETGGTTLGFSRLYGGSDSDEGYGVATNGAYVAVAGYTSSDDLPAAGSAADGQDAFVVKMLTSNGAINFAKVFGGAGSDYALTAAFDGGSIVVAGQTSSTDFPTVDPVQAQNAGGSFDAFVSKFTGSGTTVYSTYLGGTNTEQPNAIAVDESRSAAFVVGQTGSTDFGSTATHSGSATPLQANNAGNFDAFAAQIRPPPGVISSGPAEDAHVSSTAADFGLSPSETGSSFNCKLDGGSYSVCTSPGHVSSLAEGAHTFTMRFVDAGGGTDGTTDARHWVVDITPPEAFGLTTPTQAALVPPTNEFHWPTTTDALGDITGYDLYVDDEKAASAALPCTPDCHAQAGPLASGAHTWYAVATDEAGNERQSDTRDFTVDASGPSAPVPLTPGESADVQTTTPLLMWAGSSDDASGLQDYDIELDGKALGLHLSPSTTSFTTSALTEGSHEWRVIARDNFGNTTPSPLRHFRLDVTAPSAQLAVAPNPALVGRPVTLDGSGSSDPSGGRITRYEWDLDGDGSYETDGGAAATLTRTFDAPGTFVFGLRVSDAVGLTNTSASTLRVNSAPIPADQLGVSINSGAQYTRTPDVKLALKFPSTTTQILVSNDGGFLVPTTFAPSQSIAWKLDSSGPERLPKTVYVRFLIGPIVSETYTDDVILDETPPKVVQATVVPPAGASAVHAAKLRKYTVKLKATDSNSGVAAVQITAKKAKPGKFLRYKRKLRVKAASRKLYVRARDRAGNLSRWKKAR